MRAALQGLDRVQVGHLRHIDNLSRQLPNDWSLMQGRVEALKRAFRVFARRKDEPDGDHAVPHSALVHVLGPDGAHVDHWSATLPVAEMLTRLRRLLDA